MSSDTKSYVAWLVVAFSGIFDRYQRPVEDSRSVAEINAVFGDIATTLRFVPREHAPSVATLRRYVKLWGQRSTTCKLTMEVTGGPRFGAAG
jgi:hypothetical protein